MSYSVDAHHVLRRAGAAVSFHQTPNGGGALKPTYLVIHYTAGRSAASSVAWFENPAAKASAHLVIGRDGAVTQLQRFNQKCWHAGESEWNGVIGLNSHSIGIELDNLGVLDRTETGEWRAWFGTVVPAAEVMVAAHRLGGPQRGWHVYTPIQIETAENVAAALHAAYEFTDILGHDDISWPRKSDPGPAFPLASLRSRVMGRA